MLKRITLLLTTAISALAVQSQNINNPVLPNVADAGVIRYNGEYYIGGVFTRGSLYKSSDLVKWDSPVHVFSMNNEWATKFGIGDEQIHANDIVYLNGKFHMYWSVNYWGKERNVVHIAHAVSPSINGPFVEPVKDTWLDNRIDPKLFVDDDGKLYLYMVRFTDGNTIWVRPMKDPGTFAGEAKYLFSSLQNTWETADNRVEEGPWVMKYRSRYYLMYNTNHTATEWGNYALGVAETSSPVEFNHGNKYTYPVVQSNQWDMDEKYVDLLKYSDNGNFYFTTEQPAGNWNAASFDTNKWQKGKAGFGSQVIENSFSRKVKTDWNADHIWLRKDFAYNKNSNGNLALRMHHDGATKVYLNGTLIYENAGANYTSWNFDDKAKSLLKEGNNTLAMTSDKGRRSCFADISLFDMQDDKADDIMITPGQPNIVHGPNGFDWWLVYMANNNSERRAQFINQVYFFDKTLYVDALTSSNTPGYHPVPSQPTFGDLFSDANAQLKDKWNTISGTWKIAEGELKQTGNANAQAFIKADAAMHYLFEVNVKLGSSVTGKAGMYAYKKDDKNWLKISINAQTKTWQYELMQNGKLQTQSNKLAKDFDYTAYHKIAAYKNAGSVTVTIDDLPAAGSNLIKTSFTQKGLSGIFSENTAASFDGIVYTMGWDEYDNTITGWESRRGNWQTSDQGLSQLNAVGENVVLKGDLVNAFDFNTQIKTDGTAGEAGVYAMYADDNNFIKAGFDYAKKKLVISVKLQGKALPEKEISLERQHACFADMTYSDFMEKHFTFKNPVYLNAMELNKDGHLNTDTLIEKIYEKVNISYRDGENWHSLTYTPVASGHPALDKIRFETIKVDELRFSNVHAEDHNFYIYKLWANEVFKQSHNLRVVKNGTGIKFLVDGRLVDELKNSLPASKVGLFTNDAKASFNGITLYDIR